MQSAMCLLKGTGSMCLKFDGVEVGNWSLLNSTAWDCSLRVGLPLCPQDRICKLEMENLYIRVFLFGTFQIGNETVNRGGRCVFV